jgi:penicillin-binding protein 1C
MVTAVRSPGSTLKPFLYGIALDDGRIHSESLLLDVPMSFGGYSPGNFQAAFSGPVSVARALQRSLNVPAVDLLDRVGPARFASVMLSGGVHLRMPAGAVPNLSLILGGGGTTLEELVAAYRALARAGPGPGLENGTSFGFRDAWAVGVTDNWTIGVWVGRPDGTPNPGYFGANIAAPLLKDIVSALPAGPPRAHPPRGGPGDRDLLAARCTARKRIPWRMSGTTCRVGS